MRVRVVCTLWVTIEILMPTSQLASVDLPALGAPISATNPQRVAGLAHPSPPEADSGIAQTVPNTFAQQYGRGRRLFGRAFVRSIAVLRLKPFDFRRGK